MSHRGAQYYLYVRWVEQPLSQCGVDRSLSLPATVATLTQEKHWLYVQPSVSLISNFFDRFFEYPRKSASLLSSAVIWCFYTLDMNLTQLLLLSLYKKKKLAKFFHTFL